MAVWTTRTSGYKLGVLALFLGSAFYLIGYASPFWMSSGSFFSGLWLSCGERGMYGVQCVSFSISSVSGGWFKAVQAMQSIGLIGVFITCIFALVVNCFKASHTHCRWLEISSAVSGACGFIGCMVFVGKLSRYMYSRQHIGWAFGLNLTGCLILMIVAIIIYITNRPDLATGTPGGVIYSGAAPMQGVAVVQPQGQAYPAPGVPPQAGFGVQPGGYVVQSGYAVQPGYAPQPGYAAQPGYAPQPGYPAQPGYSAGYAAPQAGYSAQAYTEGYSAQVPSAPEPK